MSFDDYSDYDALGLADLIRKGEVSAREVTQAAIERIEALNPTLNAVMYKAFDEALELCDEGFEGPFAGVPFLIKDLDLKVAGWPQSNGSKFTRDLVNDEDAELTSRYRDAGLNFLGTTNTPEFGITGTTESGHLGPCRNPWNENHSTGGSSGGAAAAVASGMVPMAHATDGLGSIRIPAACCGLFGLKPTRDRTPMAPNYREAAHGFVCQHVVSRTVRDSAALLDATDYRDPLLPAPAPPKDRPFLNELNISPGRLRIAFSTRTPRGTPIDPDVQMTIDTVARVLEAMGHYVEEKDLEIDWRAFYGAQAIKSCAHFAAEMQNRIARLGREPQDDELEPLTWSILEASKMINGEMVADATRSLFNFSSDILRQLGRYDAYITPVMTAPPAEIGFVDPVGLTPKEVNKRQGQLYPYTPPFNISGQPSMSLPLGQSSTGLPIGVMVTARYGDEATLFRLAAQLEDEMPWIGRRPKHWK